MLDLRTRQSAREEFRQSAYYLRKCVQAVASLLVSSKAIHLDHDLIFAEIQPSEPRYRILLKYVMT